MIVSSCDRCVMRFISWSLQIAKFMGPTWGPPGSCRPQMGPKLAPWTLLSGSSFHQRHNCYNAGGAGCRVTSRQKPWYYHIWETRHSKRRLGITDARFAYPNGLLDKGIGIQQQKHVITWQWSLHILARREHHEISKQRQLECLFNNKLNIKVNPPMDCGFP